MQCCKFFCCNNTARVIALHIESRRVGSSSKVFEYYVNVSSFRSTVSSVSNDIVNFIAPRFSIARWVTLFHNLVNWIVSRNRCWNSIQTVSKICIASRSIWTTFLPWYHEFVQPMFLSTYFQEFHNFYFLVHRFLPSRSYNWNIFVPR